MLQVGDTIQCHDADDMIRTMTELEKENITTDFMYEKTVNEDCGWWWKG